MDPHVSTLKIHNIILQFFLFFFFVVIHYKNQTKLTYLRICVMRNNHNPNIGALFAILVKELSLFSLTTVLKHISLLDVRNVREK